MTWSEEKIKGVCDLMFAERGPRRVERAKRLLRFWGRPEARCILAASFGTIENGVCTGCGRVPA